MHSKYLKILGLSSLKYISVLTSSLLLSPPQPNLPPLNYSEELGSIGFGRREEGKHNAAKLQCFVPMKVYTFHEDMSARFLSNISNTSDSVSSGYPNTEKRVENTACSGVFLTKFEVFG